VGFAVVHHIFNLGYHLLPAGCLAEAVGCQWAADYVSESLQRK
jgi:hypothetical protein